MKRHRLLICLGLLLVVMTLAVGISAKTQLTLWTHLGQHPKLNQWYEDRGREFAELHPEISGVDVVVIPYEGYEARYLSAFMGRVGAPDIFVGMAHDWAGTYQFADPTPTHFASMVDDKVSDDLRLLGMWDGVRYGVPIGGSNFMMLYINADMFREAGLDPDKPIETLDQLVDAAKKLTKYDKSGKVTRAGFAIRYSGHQVGITEKYLPFAHTFGARMVSPDWTKGSGYTNSPQAVKALEFFVDLVYTHKVSSLEVGVPETAFAQGLAAMIFRESWLVGWLRDNAPHIKYRTWALPYQDIKVGSGAIFAWADMVYRDSPNKDWAWKYLEYIWTQADDLGKYEIQGLPPVWQDNLESDYMKGRPDYAATIEMVQSREPAPTYFHEKTNEVVIAYGDAILEAVFGHKTPQQALDDAAIRIDRILQD